MEPLRVVVVGAGRMGCEHAEALRLCGDRVVGVVDTDPARARAVSRRFEARPGVLAPVGPRPRARPRDREALAVVLEPYRSEGASAVVVASPTDSHMSDTLTAVDLGFHVLVEKPPWLPGEDPGQLLARVASAGSSQVAIGMSTRFNPGIRALYDVVARGLLGSILAASDRVAFTLVQGDLAEWYLDPAISGGGVVVTNGVHSLDRMAWLLGTRLDLVSSRRSGEYLKSCDDVAVLELTAGKTSVQVVQIWSPGPVPPSELVVVGTAGSFWADAAGNWRQSSLVENGEGQRPAGYQELVAQWAAFRSLVLDGRRDPALAAPADLVATMDLLREAMRP